MEDPFMKKFVPMVILAIAAIPLLLCVNSSPVQAQSWDTWWTKLSSPIAAYDWMSGSLGFTGLAYDKKRDLIYVVSPRTNQGVYEANIFILSASTGDTLGRLFVDKNIIYTGFSLGRFSLFKVQVNDSGQIFACNLVTPLWGICYPGPPPNCDPLLLNQGPFKIFKWETPTSAPILVYKTPGGDPGDTVWFGGAMSYTRWGDALGIVGVRDSMRLFASGGDPSGRAMNSEFDIFTPTDATTNTFGIGLKVMSSLNGLASHGLAPTGKLPNAPVWCDNNQRIASLQTQQTTPVSIYSLPPNVTRTSGTIRYFELPEYGRKFVIVCDGKNDGGGDSTKARLIDVTDQNQAFLEGDPTPPVGTRGLNGSSGTKNWVNDVDYKLERRDDGIWLTVFVLMSNNGIGAYRMTYPLPVELASFKAEIIDDNIELKWNVTAEYNNYGFEVQRSLNGGNDWELLGFVKGRGTVNDPKVYTFSDPVKNLNLNLPDVRYRLRQIDFDGRSHLSPFVQVLLGSIPNGIDLAQNYPNPFSAGSSGNPTTIVYQITQPGFVSMKIFNSVGQEMKMLVCEMKDKGTHLVTVDAADLPSGTHYYQLRAHGKTLQKKMVVIK